MPNVSEPLKDAKQTAAKIADLIRKYSGDLHLISIETPAGRKRLDELTLLQFFNFAKNIPYKLDEKPVEVVGRPYRLLSDRLGGLDCKKKTCLCGSFLNQQIKKRSRLIQGFQLVGSSDRADRRIHHIFTKAKIKGRWRVVDSTYARNRLFGNKAHTKEVIFYDSTK